MARLHRGDPATSGTTWAGLGPGDPTGSMPIGTSWRIESDGAGAGDPRADVGGKDLRRPAVRNIIGPRPWGPPRLSAPGPTRPGPGPLGHLPARRPVSR